MKRVAFLMLFCCLVFCASAQQACDTIVLNNGLRFRGTLTSMQRRTLTFKNCDSTAFTILTVKKRDVKNITGPYKISYDSNRDTTCYWHIGIIPYQILSRSSGAYFRCDFKGVSLEYRPTYTYATNINVGSLDLFNNDNWYFQGINNSLVLYKPVGRKSKIGAVVSYKYWWHNKISIDNNGSSYAFDDAHYKQSKSDYMSGIGFGVEFSHELINSNHFEISVFTNVSLTIYRAHTHLFSYDGGNYRPPGVTYPSDQTDNVVHGNMTGGFKFGYKKIRKK